MPDLPGFAGQLATPRHGLNPLETLSLKLSRVRHRNRAMRRKGCGTYSDQAPKRQAYVSKAQRPSMMPKKPAPDLIRGGTRLSDEIMLKTKNLDHDPIRLNRIMV
jgi:hypothetical protein